MKRKPYWISGDHMAEAGSCLYMASSEASRQQRLFYDRVAAKLDVASASGGGVWLSGRELSLICRAMLHVLAHYLSIPEPTDALKEKIEELTVAWQTMERRFRRE